MIEIHRGWWHAGKTNGFHVSTASDLARCYNDNSVLENHHCALTYDLISKCELLNHLEKPVQLVRPPCPCICLQYTRSVLLNLAVIETDNLAAVVSI